MYIQTEKIKTYGDDKVQIVIGPNGCGKSYWLRSQIDTNDSAVIAISTTFDNKFNNVRGKNVSVLTPRSRSYKVSNVMLGLLKRIAKGDGKMRYSFATLLEYIGYSPIIFVDLDYDYGAFESDYLIDSGLITELKAKIEQLKCGRGVPVPLDLYSHDSEEISSLFVKILMHRNEKHYYETDDGYNYTKQFISKIKFYLKKDDSMFEVSNASSGELQMLRTLGYIYLNVTDGCRILFDEPENSLHPKWQIEFVNQILTFFEKYNAKIYIATHSPLIVAGLDCEIKKYHSIEETLWDQFSVVTPKSYYFAQLISEELNNIAVGRSEPYNNKILQQLKNKACDDDQKTLLRKLINRG
jgi:predicted ATPase